MRLTLFLRENIGQYREGWLDREYENVVAVLATFAGEYENRTPVVLISAPALAHHISTHSF